MDSADTIFKSAKARTNKKKKDDDETYYEELPKWKVLLGVLREIEGERKEMLENDEDGTFCPLFILIKNIAGPVLILAHGYKTCNQLTSILKGFSIKSSGTETKKPNYSSIGIEKLFERLAKRYAWWKRKLTGATVKKKTPTTNETKTKITRPTPSSKPTGSRSAVDNFAANVTAARNAVSKRRRVRGGGSVKVYDNRVDGLVDNYLAGSSSRYKTNKHVG